MNRERRYWLDEPRNVARLFWCLCAACGLLFIADAFYEKHPHFEAEGWFGFYGIFGFLACISLVVIAKILRRLVERPENYYD